MSEATDKDEAPGMELDVVAWSHEFAMQMATKDPWEYADIIRIRGLLSAVQGMFSQAQATLTSLREENEALKGQIARHKNWEDQAAQSASRWKVACFGAERKAEAAEARISELEKVLEPFADFGGYLEAETTGFSDDESLCLFPEESFFELFRLKIRHFRAARNILKGDAQ